MRRLVNPDREQALRVGAQRLSAIRNRPCLIFSSDVTKYVWPDIEGALEGTSATALDLIINSPGGDINAAYTIARNLRRRFKQVGAFVPSWAKSAATLICLCADELVIGENGELGPLDVQLQQQRKGDFPRLKSALERFKGLEQLQRHAVETFDVFVMVCLRAGRMQLSDACGVAADLSAKLVGPMYGKVDPDSLGENARFLALGEEYVHRVLRRYRPDVYDDELVHDFVWGYPDHGFVIDVEELNEKGIPARFPSEDEEPIVHDLCTLFDEAMMMAEEDLIALEAAPQVASSDAGMTEDMSESSPTENGEKGVASIRRVVK